MLKNFNNNTFNTDKNISYLILPESNIGVMEDFILEDYEPLKMDSVLNKNQIEHFNQINLNKYKDKEKISYFLANIILEQSKILDLSNNQINILISYQCSLILKYLEKNKEKTLFQHSQYIIKYNYKNEIPVTIEHLEYIFNNFGSSQKQLDFIINNTIHKKNFSDICFIIAKHYLLENLNLSLEQIKIIFSNANYSFNSFEITELFLNSKTIITNIEKDFFIKKNDFTKSNDFFSKLIKSNLSLNQEQLIFVLDKQLNNGNASEEVKLGYINDFFHNCHTKKIHFLEKDLIDLIKKYPQYKNKILKNSLILYKEQKLQIESKELIDFFKSINYLKDIDLFISAICFGGKILDVVINEFSKCDLTNTNTFYKVISSFVYSMSEASESQSAKILLKCSENPNILKNFINLNPFFKFDINKNKFSDNLNNINYNIDFILYLKKQNFYVNEHDDSSLFSMIHPIVIKTLGLNSKNYLKKLSKFDESSIFWNIFPNKNKTTKDFIQKQIYNSIIFNKTINFSLIENKIEQNFQDNEKTSFLHKIELFKQAQEFLSQNLNELMFLRLKNIIELNNGTNLKESLKSLDFYVDIIFETKNILLKTTSKIDKLKIDNNKIVLDQYENISNFLKLNTINEKTNNYLIDSKINQINLKIEYINNNNILGLYDYQKTLLTKQVEDNLINSINIFNEFNKFGFILKKDRDNKTPIDYLIFITKQVEQNIDEIISSNTIKNSKKHLIN